MVHGRNGELRGQWADNSSNPSGVLAAGVGSSMGGRASTLKQSFLGFLKLCIEICFLFAGAGRGSSHATHRPARPLLSSPFGSSKGLFCVTFLVVLPGRSGPKSKEITERHGATHRNEWLHVSAVFEAFL